MKPTLTLTTRSPEQTRQIGRKLGEFCRSGDWIGLTGDLGAGKTCFVRGLAKGLEVPEGYQVTSPTFIIHQTYPGKIPLHHLDLYRIHTGMELVELGYHEIVEGDGVCAVEWFQNVPDAMAGFGLAIEIEIVDENTRIVGMAAIDNRGSELLSRLKESL
jgi:tRNA threonylcarbamoyladenosine biosynthesis protein TsaE